MTDQLLTDDDVRALLREECEKAGSQSAWGREHQIAQGIVNKTISGRRAIGKRICAALGIESAKMFRKKA